MTVEIVAVIVILAFAILVAMEIPIGIAMAAGGGLGIVLLEGIERGGGSVARLPYTSTAKYALFIIPMFVLLGNVVANSGIGDRIFAAAYRIVRRLPGGLAATTVVATTLFGGISGSSAADVAALGRIAVNQMSKRGYQPSYAAAIVAASGTLAILIPPSIAVVIYGIIAGESIGALLLAGIIPGTISALIYILYVVYVGQFRSSSRRFYIMETATPASVKSATDTGGEAAGVTDENQGIAETKANLLEIDQSAAAIRHDLSGVVYALALFLIVIGGIYTGTFTAMEAGAMGAFAAIVMGIMATRATRFWTSLLTSLRETASISSMIFLLLIGGATFNFFMAQAGIPSAVTEWATGLAVPPKVLVAVLLLLLVPLGMVLDGLSIMLLTIPLLAPVVDALGFSGIWFGILVLKMIEIGLITPPLGINVYVVSGVIEDAKVERVFRSILPFLVLDLVTTAIFFTFPGLVTWLPSVARV